jgi:hypothetical protein
MELLVVIFKQLHRFVAFLGRHGVVGLGVCGAACLWLVVLDRLNHHFRPAANAGQHRV